MPLHHAYEIHAAVKKRWKLVARASDSRQAVDDAVALQQGDTFDAVRVVVRPAEASDTAKAQPRLIYQFTRPGHDPDGPAPTPAGGSGAIRIARLMSDLRELSISLGIVKYWIAGALILALAFEGCG